MAEVTEIFKRLSLGGDKMTNMNKTGLVYDDKMAEHQCLWDNHIEKPERYLFPLERCKHYGLVDRCVQIPSRPANEEELKTNHSQEYIDVVRGSSHIVDDPERLEKLSSDYDSVYFHPKTYESALLAAGCTIDLVSAVVEGRLDNGMAIVRPPGHHALPNDACGFCFFNNVALATKHVLKKYELDRVLIIDWDVHHGQATQFAFYDDPRVLYFSIHRYMHGDFWPCLRESNFDYIGSGQGKGFNFNVPLNKTGLGNTEYLAIFHNLLLPVAYEYNPDLVIVSAGFDAALGCPEGEMEVAPHLYPHLLNLVSGLAGGKVCVILEGGYCLPSLSESVALCLRSLLGDPCPAVSGTEMIDDSVVETILNVISMHRPFWRSLRMQDVYENGDDDDDNSVGDRHIVQAKFISNTVLCKPYQTREYSLTPSKIICPALESKLEKLIGKADLTVPDQRTCVVTDSRMNQHVNHQEKNHPECKKRLSSIVSKLEEKGILNRCFQLVARRATECELELVHDPEFISKIKSSSSMKHRDIAKMAMDYVSVYMCPETYDCALLACGSLLQTVDAVLSRKCSNGFALIRPPGHHAEASEACGFCIFNSVSIAAKYAQKKYSLKKILIVDWDVHHGNGTQNIFYKDDSVLYISLHRYDNATFFPNTEDANYDACGEDSGAGYNINVPWNGEMSDGDYLAAFTQIVLPVAYEFCPDLVLVSAGFDAAVNDPLGDCKVSPAFYGHMTRLLSGLASGKIVLALEGGYNIVSISESVCFCFSSLLGEPPQKLPSGLTPSDTAIATIRNVIRTQQKYWRCLQFGVRVPNVSEMVPEEPIVDNSVSSGPVDIPNTGEVSVATDVLTPSSMLNVFLVADTTQSSEPESRLNEPMNVLVTPMSWCPHLDLLQSLPAEGLNPSDPCLVCRDERENWVCLHCYQVYCGRFINGHMLEHGMNMQHYLTLSYSDLSVWCYACDSYVHNEVLMDVKEHVHVMKFNVRIF